MIWHVYPGDTLPVLVGARALCGHVAEVETDQPIGPDDERCAVCVALLAAGEGTMTGAEQSDFGPEKIARRFHEVYEELAPVYGWQTQQRSAKPWEEVPTENRRLMVKVVSRLIHEGTITRGSRS